MELKTIQIEIPAGKKAEWVNGVLTLVDEQSMDNRPVTERIKSFEDARKELGEDNPLVIQYKVIAENEDKEDVFNTGKDIIAYLKLRIIAAALNEGWMPQFTENENRWHPWFKTLTEREINDKSKEWKAEHKLWFWGGGSSHGANCGLVCASSASARAFSSAALSARLAVKSEKLAIYFGEQFINIWSDYIRPFSK